MILLVILVSFDSCVFSPHLLHASTSIVCFPDLTFLGTIREPHSLQKSIQPTLPLLCNSLIRGIRLIEE